jgi:glycyl-tRNA synthetase alpha chain
MVFQDMVSALETFWRRQGCLVVPPYDTEKGAGTMSPFTFFRALGPEPWRVASVEPSRRPADGRYGDNPNRLYRHHQFQVVLKPSPPDSTGLYLESLRALGIEPKDHDIRFVEDNWEAPTLGAHGLGWEVWLDGMEVSQFTYFQSMGQTELRPVSVEMTYGLERLAAYLQNVSSVFDVEYGHGVTLREMFHAGEAQHSRYAFEASDAALLARQFDASEAEARRALDHGLYLPAYDLALHASHLFNLLEARGAQSVGQRTARVARIRALTRDCARAYLEDRERLGHPLLAAAGSAAAGVTG